MGRITVTSLGQVSRPSFALPPPGMWSRSHPLWRQAIMLFPMWEQTTSPFDHGMVRLGGPTPLNAFSEDATVTAIPRGTSNHFSGWSSGLRILGDSNTASPTARGLTYSFTADGDRSGDEISQVAKSLGGAEVNTFAFLLAMGDALESNVNPRPIFSIEDILSSNGAAFTLSHQVISIFSHDLLIYTGNGVLPDTFNIGSTTTVPVVITSNGTAGIRVYVNGILYGSYASRTINLGNLYGNDLITNSVDFGSRALDAVNPSPNKGNATSYAHMGFVGVFGQAWSQAEIERWSQDPFEMFRPRRRIHPSHLTVPPVPAVVDPCDWFAGTPAGSWAAAADAAGWSSPAAAGDWAGAATDADWAGSASGSGWFNPKEC